MLFDQGWTRCGSSIYLLHHFPNLEEERFLLPGDRSESGGNHYLSLKQDVRRLITDRVFKAQTITEPGS